MRLRIIKKQKAPSLFTEKWGPFYQSMFPSSTFIRDGAFN
jgi:hypothetical protein